MTLNAGCATLYPVQRASNRGHAAAAVGAALLLAGCSTGSSESEEGQPTGETAPNIVQPGAPGEPSRTLSVEELAALEGTEHGDIDVAFMQGMIHHHAQALRMTALVPERSASAKVELLAKRIDVSQEGEIEQMSDWLKERGEPAPELHRLHGHAHGGGQVLMPGMLSEPELRRLEAATGEQFDRLFLEFMIRHHEGALKMVEQLYAGGGGLESAVDAFARHVDADQQIEIGRMQELLAERS
jgi:uncharacterized protein (DUF305 family)